MNFSFIVFILIDQITKALSVHRDFFFGGIHFHPVRNYSLPLNLDFGWGANFTVLLALYLGVGWVIASISSSSRWAQWGKAMLWAGASSNLADRLLFGYVRDFIDFNLGFVFNLADVLIILGIILVLLDNVLSKSKDNPRPLEQINN